MATRTVRRHVFEYNEKLYSIQELAEIAPNGITYDTLYRKLVKKGMTVEAAFALRTPGREDQLYRGTTANVEYKGQLYTISELYKLATVKMSESHFRKRLKTMSVDEALTTPILKRDPNRRFEYKGNWYLPEELLKFAVKGITLNIILNRLWVGGFTAEEAVSTPKNGRASTRKYLTKNQRKYVYNGKSYILSDLHKFANKSVSIKTLKNRLTNHKEWSVEKALLTPYTDNTLTYTYNGVSYIGLTALKVGIGFYGTVGHLRQLLDKFYDDIDAVIAYSKEELKTRDRSLIEDPVTKENLSLTELARRYNILQGTAYNRYHTMDWSIGETLEMEGRGLVAKVLNPKFKSSGLIVSPVRAQRKGPFKFSGDFVDEEGFARIRCLIEKTREYIYLTPEEIVNFKEGG